MKTPAGAFDSSSEKTWEATYLSFLGGSMPDCSRARPHISMQLAWHFEYVMYNWWICRNPHLHSCLPAKGCLYLGEEFWLCWISMFIWAGQEKVKSPILLRHSHAMSNVQFFLDFFYSCQLIARFNWLSTTKYWHVVGNRSVMFGRVPSCNHCPPPSLKPWW